jgi:hypothetical protein
MYVARLKKFSFQKMYSLDLPLQEVDSYRFLVVLCESAFAISLDHARFAHSTVAHDHHLCTNPDGIRQSRKC